MTLTVDGHSATAFGLRELEHDLLVYRWSETLGRDVEMGRFCVTATQDVASADRHSVNVTALDYFGVLAARVTTRNWPPVNMDQDDIVATFVNDWGRRFHRAAGAVFGAGSYLPLVATPVYADGTPGRPPSSQMTPAAPVRQRSYNAGQNVGDAITNLAAVIRGFDFDVAPAPGFAGPDRLRIFYPGQGVQRDFALVYRGADWGGGGNLREFTRQVNASGLGNYAWVSGQAEEDQGGVTAPVPWAERDIHQLNPAFPAPDDPIANPVGLWPVSESFSDVTEQATLQEKADGLVEASAGSVDESGRPVVTPSYTVTMTGYTDGLFDLGDTVRLVIQSGRLDVDTFERIIGINWAVNDDDPYTDDVDVDLGRPSAQYGRLMAERRARARLQTLERRNVT